jgi:biotin operon repressor
VTEQVDIPRSLLKQLYYDEGLSQRQIAERLGCSEWTVRSQMRQYGLQARRPGGRRRWAISEDLLRRLYCEENLSQAKIAEQIGCGERVIRARMREYGIRPKSPADYKKLDVPEPLLRELYCRDRLSLLQIAGQLGCSQTVILRRLQEYGIDRRPRGGTRQHKVRDHILNTWTPDLAYTVGLITADGSLSSDSLEVSFASTDVEIIEAYLRILEVDASIQLVPLKGNRKPLHKATINDPSYRAFLEGIGLMPAKAKRLGPLGIPDSVFRDFLRGCIDGDGSIYVAVYRQPVYKDGDRRLLVATLYSSSRPFLEWVRDTALRLAGLWRNVNEDKRGYCSLAYTGRKAISLLHWVYYAPELPCLTRKRAVFESYLDSKS